MAYQVTARKWRPAKFSDMVGQEHIARTLRNAIISGRIAHAYLFVGPRGIGKTTSARIFAKALNCEHPVDGEPCCECASCRSIADESNVDIIEIDAATHTQVDKAREICEDVLHLPIASKYKIYIIDEVHMLSKSAWNALLKTIEEPPAHAKFIFATTEVNKVLPTVISRCQRFDLKRIPSDLIAQRLAYISSQENIKISQGALNVIARAADGGMRDAQSLLDQLVSFFGTDSKEEITEEQALSLFGMTSPEEMIDLVRAILDDDRKNVILSIHRFAEQGKNLESLYEEVLTWLRGIMLSIILPSPETVLDENPERIADYRTLAAGHKSNIIQTLLEKLSESTYLLRESINKQIFMETIMLKSMRAAHSVSIENLITRLNQIRRSGELEGTEKIPTLAAIPVAAPVQLVQPVQPVQSAQPVQPVQPISQNPPQIASIPAEPVKAAPVPVEKKTPDPVIEKSVQSAPEPVTVPVAEVISEPVVKPAEEPVPVPTQTNLQASAEEPRSENEKKEKPFNESNMDPVKIWEYLSAEARKVKKVSLAELMLLGVPQRIEETGLVVAFDQDYGETALEAVYADIRYLMKLLADVSPLTEFRFLRLPGIRTVQYAKREKALETLKQEAAPNATVKAALDLFSGEIIDVLETEQTN